MTRVDVGADVDDVNEIMHWQLGLRTGWYDRQCADTHVLVPTRDARLLNYASDKRSRSAARREWDRRWLVTEVHMVIQAFGFYTCMSTSFT